MGEFASTRPLKIVAWTMAAVIIALNGYLAWTTFGSISEANPALREVAHAGLIVISGGLFVLLATLIAWPWIGERRRLRQRVVVEEGLEARGTKPMRGYANILVPLDHTASDQEAISNALSLARANKAKIILLHIEEGVASRLYGSMASTAEVKEGEEYLNEIADSLRAEGLETEIVVRHGSSPAREIELAAKELKPDLVIMAAHGHRGLKDLILGSTINRVRHRLKIPMLIVQEKDKK
jgi:manganese transport protein